MSDRQRFGPLEALVDIEEPLTRRVLVLLHGRGTDASDLIGLGDVLGFGGRTVAFDAPRPWIEAGRGRSWYGAETQRADLDSSVDALVAALSALAARWPAPGSCVLAGFSQGGVMTYETGLTHPQRFSALIVFSGFLPADSPVRRSTGRVATTPPLFITHGAMDPLIDVNRAREAEAFLTKSEVGHEYVEDLSGHTISPRQLVAARSFLDRNP